MYIFIVNIYIQIYVCIERMNAPRWVAIRRRRHCGILSCIGFFSAMAHKLCSVFWLMLSLAPLLSFSISAMDADTSVQIPFGLARRMDADTSVQIPFGLARRILRLLTTIRAYIDKIIATMISADDMIVTIIRELGTEIEAQGGQPHPFHGPIF